MIRQSYSPVSPTISWQNALPTGTSNVPDSAPQHPLRHSRGSEIDLPASIIVSVWQWTLTTNLTMLEFYILYTYGPDDLRY